MIEKLAQLSVDESMPLINTTTNNVDAAAAAGIFAAMGGLMIFFVIWGLVGFAIWLWALLDVIKRDFANPSDKNLWMILVIIGLFIANPIIPIIYLVVGRKKGTTSGGPAAPTQTPPSQTPPTQTPPAA